MIAALCEFIREPEKHMLSTIQEQSYVITWLRQSDLDLQATILYLSQALHAFYFKKGAQLEYYKFQLCFVYLHSN